MNHDSVNEDALASGPTVPCFQLFNVDDTEALNNVMLALRERLERREVVDEETVYYALSFYLTGPINDFIEREFLSKRSLIFSPVKYFSESVTL